MFDILIKLLIIALIMVIIYVFVRILAFGITKSFYEGRISFYQKYKNKLLKKEK